MPQPESHSEPRGVGVTGPGRRVLSFLLDAALVSVTLGIGWAIWASMTAPNGQSPAKRLLKIRVIDAVQLQPLGFARMFFVRGVLANFLALVAFTFTLGILALMPFWDRRSQTIYEKISNTLVVDDPYNAWNR